MLPRVPDADALGLPGFDRADGARPRRHTRHVPATAGSRVLNHCHRVQIDNARLELAILRRRGWLVLPFSAALRWVVERPVLHFALTTLHGHAADAVVAVRVRRQVAG